MKKLFAAIAVLTLVFLLFASSAAAEQFDGFSIEFPADFTGAYTDVDNETESDFFTEDLAYETESDYELMQVLIGESTNLEALFAEDFGFANRQDLDLSLLTEEQLADEAEELTAYIDMSFPLYMTYVTPTSMVVDDRLCLIVTGYYTDYQGGLTGEFRAYEFYYMGQVIIIYYDTQIEGTYFVESVFDLPNSIVETLDFDLNPEAQPMNASLYKDLVETAAPVGGLLAAAVVLGALFGFVFRKTSRKDSDFDLTLSSDITETDTTKPKKEKVSKKSKQNDTSSPASPEPATPTLSEADNNEAVDWSSMLSSLRKDTEAAKKTPTIEAPASEPKSEPKTEDTPAAEEKAVDEEKTLETPTKETKIVDERAPKERVEKAIAFDAVDPIPIETPAVSSEPTVEEPAVEKSTVVDPLLAQLQEMDDMSAEISATLGSLENLGSANQPKEPEVLKELQQEPKNSEDISFSAPTPEIDLPKSKNAESVSANYQSYLNSLLPTRKKPKNAEEDAAQADATPKENSSAQATAAPAEPVKPVSTPAPASETFTESKVSEPTKKEKKQGILSRMLSSVADRIEKDGEENTEPEFDSRAEMHIREKTERHSVDKLMPGLFDEDPEEESVEILLDQGEDLKFERSKTKAKKSDADKNKQVKSRVDDLFND